MSTKRLNRISRVQACLLAGLGALALGLAGCSGDEGSRPTTTPPDPVFPPGPGSGVAIPISTAHESIVGSITRVTVPADGRPVVEIYLRDEQNFSLKGLPAANVSFVLARLEPAANGASSTWHAITRKTEALPGDTSELRTTGSRHRHRPAQPGDDRAGHRRHVDGPAERRLHLQVREEPAGRRRKSRSTARCRIASVSRSG